MNVTNAKQSLISFLELNPNSIFGHCELFILLNKYFNSKVINNEKKKVLDYLIELDPTCNVAYEGYFF